MASLTLSPSQGQPGTTLTVAGSGYDAGATLTATFGGILVALADSLVAGDGTFSTTLTVPSLPVGADITYDLILSDNVGATAGAVFDMCGIDNGDGIDTSNGNPVLASGGEPGDFNGQSLDLPVYAYIHHDGAHYVAWRDASVGSQFGTGDPDTDPRLQLPPQANHTLNVTMVPDDGGAVVTYEVDTDYCWEFQSGTGRAGEGFICQCSYLSLVSADPIWQAGFWIENWMKSVMDVKFASDGSNLWMAVLTRETVIYPYISSDDDVNCSTISKDCSSPSAASQFESLDGIVSEMPVGNHTAIDRRYHPAVGIPDDIFYEVRTRTTDDGESHTDHWSPPRIVMFSGGTGGFTRIGSMDAKFCPGITSGNTHARGGAILGGYPGNPTQASPRGSFFSGISIAASEAEPGVCHVVWSEGGDWGECGGGIGFGGGSGVDFVAFPPPGTLGANILSNGDFSGGLTNWVLDGGWADILAPEVAELDGTQLRMYLGDTSVYKAGQFAPPPISQNPLTPDHGSAGLIYQSNEWQPPAGVSVWQMTFTWQRRPFTDLSLPDQVIYFSDVTQMPWGGVGYAPEYPGSGIDGLYGDGAYFGSFQASGYGYFGPWLAVGPNDPADGPGYIIWPTLTESSPDVRVSPSGGGPHIGDSIDFTFTFTIDNVGPAGVPPPGALWNFGFTGPLQLYDPWDFGSFPWWYAIGWAVGISNVTLKQLTPDDPIPTPGSSGGPPALGGGTGFDGGPGNRDYRVGYSTWDAGGKTSEVDLFSSHIDRSGFYFNYDFDTSDDFNVGYSWPTSDQLMASGVHAVRNDHGSPVLFIGWPNIVTNPDQQDPDSGGASWLDNGHVFTQPELQMYDIAGGTPTLLQTLGGDLLPTEEEVQHFWPAGAAPNTLHGGMLGYNEDPVDDRTATRGSGTIIDRAIGVSRIYEDPLLGGTPVYLLHVPWTNALPGLLGPDSSMRCFYRVPCDGSAAFDFLDGIRQVEFTIMDDHQALGIGQGHEWTSQDFYSDPHNIWVPHADGFGLQYDRVCAHEWQFYATVPQDGGYLRATNFGAWGSDYDTENDTISFVSFSQDFPVSLFDFVVEKICRECVPCKCVPVGMHVWQKV